ncbi:uncharacterized protein ACRADG_006947 [Cochliomyia hominivorax]
MWLKYKNADVQLFVALILLLHNDVQSASAGAVAAQFKNSQQQQQLLIQPSIQHQQLLHNAQQRSQTQHQSQTQQQQSLQSSIAAHPTNSIGGTSTNTNSGHNNVETQGIPPTSPSSVSAHLPAAQYAINDKEAVMQEVLQRFNSDDDLNDSYHMFNEFQRDGHLKTSQGNPSPPSPPPLMAASTISANLHHYPWNLYDNHYAANNLPPPPMTGLFSQIINPFENFPTPFPVTPRFLPIMSYPQPVYVPYPFIMPPEMFYPGYASLPPLPNEYEDSMSRGAGSARRPTSNVPHSSSFARNSPIYYVRLPPTPYMFLPPPTPLSGYPTMLPYQSLPSFPSFSPIFNVPVNFLANGKPNNIYQMSSPPNDIQNSIQFANVPTSFNTRPPPPPPLNAYRPAAASHNYLSSQLPTGATGAASSNYVSYAGAAATSGTPTSSSASSSSSSHLQDSKLTALKRPYYFNGRPEDIYVLPNNFNPLYASESTYY